MAGLQVGLCGVIYADANATTPLMPEVLEAMMPWLRQGFANPSGSYSEAKRARAAIDHARGQVAALIGAAPEEIVFTGSGTESVNSALISMNALCGPGAAVVSSIEHSAVLRCLEKSGRELRKIAVTGGGQLDLDAFRESLDGAAFVSVMTANNETGVIQPIQEVVAIAKARGIPVHSDAIQASGKIRLDAKQMGADMISISAHKFHGPKGIGALYIRSGLAFVPLLHGGGQESGRRSGTENTAGIVGMGAAAMMAREFLDDSGTDRLAEIRDVFESEVLSEISGVVINGEKTHRLPNTSHLSIEGCDAAGLLVLLDEAGVACSAGSACMTGKQKPSHVQIAMGIPEDRAKSSLRFGFSRLNTIEHAHAVAVALQKAVHKLRQVQGPGIGPVMVYSPPGEA